MLEHNGYGLEKSEALVLYSPLAVISSAAFFHVMWVSRPPELRLCTKAQDYAFPALCCAVEGPGT